MIIVHLQCLQNCKVGKERDREGGRHERVGGREGEGEGEREGEREKEKEREREVEGERDNTRCHVYGILYAC